MNKAELIKRQDSCWERIVSLQCMEEDSYWYGTYPAEVAPDISAFLAEGLPVYCEQASKYYKNPEVLKRMNLCADAILRRQLPSGFLSLMDCNIDSPPDAAFLINKLSICLLYIEQKHTEELQPIANKIRTILGNTVEGMMTGGFHTPNHRWVMASALGFLYQFFHDERLKQRAEAFLAEGFDINDDGEWTERSNACYNPICDIHVYYIGVIFGMETAFEAVRKNLEMTKYLFHPNYYIATEYSTRQDRGTIARMNSNFALAYRLMAGRDKNGEFLYLAQQAVKTAEKFGLFLMHTDLYEEMNAEVQAVPISDHYIKLINAGSVAVVPKSISSQGDGVLRFRSGDLSITIMAGQPDFLFFQYNNARIFGAKLPVGWFGMGGISFPSIKKIDDRTYRLHTEIHGKYWDVLDKSVAEKYNGYFDGMPNDTRQDINKVHTDAEIIVTLFDDGMNLKISANKRENIFFQLVCMFDLEGKLAGEGLVKLNNHVTKLQDGTAVYTIGDDCIEVSGNSFGHNFTFLRGDTVNRDAQNLVLNATSPEDWNIRIRCCKKER